MSIEGVSNPKNNHWNTFSGLALFFFSCFFNFRVNFRYIVKKPKNKQKNPNKNHWSTFSILALDIGSYWFFQKLKGAGSCPKICKSRFEIIGGRRAPYMQATFGTTFGSQLPLVAPGHHAQVMAPHIPLIHFQLYGHPVGAYLKALGLTSIAIKIFPDWTKNGQVMGKKVAGHVTSEGYFCHI